MVSALFRSSSQFTETDFLWFCQSLVQQLQEGLLVSESLDYIATLSSRKNQKIIQQMGQAMSQGQTLIDSLFVYAPQTIPYQLTGTDIANPQALLEWLIRYYSNKQQKRQVLMTALRYPVALMMVMMMMGVLLMTIILPQQQQLMSQMGVATPVASYSLLSIIVMIAIGSLFYSYNYIFRQCDRPVIGQLCSQLGGLLMIGVSWKRALLAIKPSKSLKDQWQSFQQDFFENPQFADQFSAHFKVIARTKMRLFHLQNTLGIGSQLVTLGHEIEQRYHDAWLQCIRLIQPLLLVGIAVIIVWVASVLLSPMISMVNQLKI